MSSITSLAARIMRLSVLRRTPIKESKAEALAARMIEHFCGVNASPEAIGNIQADEILQRLDHYREQGADIFVPHPGDPMARLEAANRAALAKKTPDGIGAAPKKMTLTDAQRTEVKNMSAAHKLAFADGTLLNKEFKND